MVARLNDASDAPVTCWCTMPARLARAGRRHVSATCGCTRS